MPARPAKVAEAGSGGNAQSRYLGESASHEAGLGIVAEIQAVTDTRAQRDDVLERAAELPLRQCRHWYRRGKTDVLTIACASRAASWLGEAITVGAGIPLTISLARFGTR